MPPKMIIDMPLPIPFSVISSPNQISSIVPATMLMMIDSVGRGALIRLKLGITPNWLLASNEPVPSACNAANGTVSPVRVLVDLVPARLALFCQLLQSWDHRHQQVAS